MGGVLAEKDGILYSVATIEDKEKILDLMKTDFIRREPVLAALNPDLGQDEEFLGLLEKFVENSISSDYSVKAFSSDTNEIVGVRLTSVVSNEAGENTFRQYLVEHSDSFGENSQKVVAWLLYVENDLPDLFYKYDVEKYVDFAALNVKEGFSNRGIGQTLLDCTLRLFEERNEGLTVFKVVTANPAIKHIYSKLGYEVIHSVPIRDFVFEGQTVLSRFDPDSDGICEVYARKYANPKRLK